MKTIIGFVFLSFLSANSYACGVNSPSYINLAISTAEEKIFSYGVKVVDEKLPSATVTNCKDTAAKRRFVMMTFGPEVVTGTDTIRGTNFDRRFVENNTCSIKNNPLKDLQTNEVRAANFHAKWKFINECVQIQVSELGPRPLSFPADQTGCSVTALSPKSAVFSGGYCFFKPSPDSELNVSISVKDSCKTTAGYKDLNINLQDLESEVNFYTSSTYKDEINDLAAIGSFPVRLSINPVSALFEPSDDFGILRPTFPGKYPLGDLHLGKIEIFDLDEKTVNVKTPFIVNNFCKANEALGLKSSVCDYATPYVGEVRLINSKGQEEVSWFDGGIAPTQWQGILNGEGEQISKDLLRKNETYKMEVTFSDPYFDFSTFKNKVKSKIQNFNNRLPVFYNNGGIADIPDMAEIGNVNQMIDINPIGDVNFPASIAGLTESRKRLGAYFSTTLYPPMYSKVCNTQTGACESTGKAFVKFTATFKVDGDYKISNLEIERNSKILGSYKKKVTDQPEYICE